MDESRASITSDGSEVVLTRDSEYDNVEGLEEGDERVPVLALGPEDDTPLASCTDLDDHDIKAEDSVEVGAKARSSNDSGTADSSSSKAATLATVATDNSAAEHVSCNGDLADISDATATRDASRTASTRASSTQFSMSLSLSSPLISEPAITEEKQLPVGATLPLQASCSVVLEREGHNDCEDAGVQESDSTEDPGDASATIVHGSSNGNATTETMPTTHPAGARQLQASSPPSDRRSVFGKMKRIFQSKKYRSEGDVSEIGKTAQKKKKKKKGKGSEDDGKEEIVSKSPLHRLQVGVRIGGDRIFSSSTPYQPPTTPRHRTYTSSSSFSPPTSPETDDAEQAQQRFWRGRANTSPAATLSQEGHRVPSRQNRLSSLATTQSASVVQVDCESHQHSAQTTRALVLEEERREEGDEDCLEANGVEDASDGSEEDPVRSATSPLSSSRLTDDVEAADSDPARTLSAEDVRVQRREMWNSKLKDHEAASQETKLQSQTAYMKKFAKKYNNILAHSPVLERKPMGSGTGS